MQARSWGSRNERNLARVVGKLVVARAHVRVEAVSRLVETRVFLMPLEVVEASSVSTLEVLVRDAPAVGLAFVVLRESVVRAHVPTLPKQMLISLGTAIERHPARYQTRFSIRLLSAPMLRTFSLDTGRTLRRACRPAQ